MSNIFDLFKQIEKQPVGIEYIVVCLGNPGNEYTFTRHNAGFLTADYISQKQNFPINRSKFKSLCGNTVISGKGVLFLKPQTYMNNSGIAVKEASRFYRVPPENIIVVSDDINLEPGQMRIRRKGSDGGHNGLKSIIYQLSSDNFPRIRLGVGKKPHPDYDLASWVLGKFTDSDKEKMMTVFDNSFHAIELIINGQTDKAMSLYN